MALSKFATPKHRPISVLITKQISLLKWGKRFQCWLLIPILCISFCQLCDFCLIILDSEVEQNDDPQQQRN